MASLSALSMSSMLPILANRIAADRDPIPLIEESSSKPFRALAAFSILRSSLTSVSVRLSACPPQGAQFHLLERGKAAEVQFPQALRVARLSFFSFTPRRRCTAWILLISMVRL